MFYSVYVLGKKGPLARIWLASHWDKKIPKSQIMETDIAESCDSILQPKVKLSLRTYSHLLLGITRIYARKTQYLLQDCQEAVFKIKSAFRFDVVDLADGEGLAPVSAITMPDMLTFINNFDLLPEPTFYFDPVAVNTAAGPYAHYNISIADVFSDSLDDPLHLNELRPDWSQVGSIAGGLIDPEEGYHSSESGNEASLASQARLSEAYLEQPPLDDGFGGPFVDEFTPNDNILGLPPRMIDTSMISTTSKQDQSMAANSLPMSPMGDISLAGANESILMPDLSVNMPDMSVNLPDMSINLPSPSLGASSPPNLFDSIRSHQADEQQMDESVVNAANESDLHQHDHQAETSFQTNSFVLEPIDSQLEQLLQAQSKRKKKRLVLAIDNVNTLSNKAVRNQLANTSDIVTPLNLAPPNKTFMKWKRTATSDSLFQAPERDIPSSVLAKYFTDKLVTRRIDTLENEEDQDPLLSMSQPELAPESSISNALENEHLEQQLEDLEAETSSQILGGSKSRKNKRKDENKENESSNPKRRRHTSKLESSVGEESQGSIQGARQRESHSLGDFQAGDDDYPGAGPLEVSSFGPGDAGQMSALFDVTNTGDARQSEAYSMDNGHLSSTPAATRLDKLRPSTTATMMSQQPNETPEQFEDRKQSSVLLKEMAPLLDATGEITFSSLVSGNKKKAAALKFYNLLVLKRLQAVELAQSLDEPYSEITISKGARFSSNSAICV